MATSQSSTPNSHIHLGDASRIVHDIEHGSNVYYVVSGRCHWTLKRKQMLLGHSKSLTSGIMALSLRMLYPLSFGTKRLSRGANPFLVCPIIKDSKFLIGLISIVVSDCLNQESKVGRLRTWGQPGGNPPHLHTCPFSVQKKKCFVSCSHQEICSHIPNNFVNIIK